MSSVLFQDGDWRICKSRLTLPGKFSSIIHHRCTHRARNEDLDRSGDWWFAAGKAYCNWCKLKIPADIKGLWILHEWDR